MWDGGARIMKTRWPRCLEFYPEGDEVPLHDMAQIVVYKDDSGGTMEDY